MQQLAPSNFGRNLHRISIDVTKVSAATEIPETPSFLGTAAMAACLSESRHSASTQHATFGTDGCRPTQAVPISGQERPLGPKAAIGGPNLLIGGSAQESISALAAPRPIAVVRGCHYNRYRRGESLRYDSQLSASSSGRPSSPHHPKRRTCCLFRLATLDWWTRWLRNLDCHAVPNGMENLGRASEDGGRPLTTTSGHSRCKTHRFCIAPGMAEILVCPDA